MPSASAFSTTARKRLRESAMEQLILRCEKASEAAANIAISELCCEGVEESSAPERYEVNPCILGVR